MTRTRTSMDIVCHVESDRRRWADWRSWIVMRSHIFVPEVDSFTEMFINAVQANMDGKNRWSWARRVDLHQVCDFCCEKMERSTLGTVRGQVSVRRQNVTGRSSIKIINSARDPIDLMATISTKSADLIVTIGRDWILQVCLDFFCLFPTVLFKTTYSIFADPV